MSKRALLIGINYKGQQDELRGCINDIKNINNVLVNSCGYNANNIKILTDESSILPTRENIENNIKWLVSNCIQGDTLVFYYSGHGSRTLDASQDESDGIDEILVPIDCRTNGFISDDWLFTNMVSKVPTNVTLWAFTDCCHSGTMIDLKYNFRSLCTYKKGTITNGMKYVPSDWTTNYAFAMERSNLVNGNVCMFSGCHDRETSADAFIANQSQGAFTYCFLDFVKGNMINGKFKNGTVKLRNLLKEINCKLDIYGFTGQNSQLSVSKYTDIERTLDL